MDKKAIRILFILVILGSCLRIFWFVGYEGYDEYPYAKLAYDMAEGNFEINKYCKDIPDVIAPVYPLRIGILVPTAMNIKIFGFNEMSIIIYPFLLSVLGIILIFFAGKIFFSVRAGIIAAAILTLFLKDIIFATKLYADLIVAFWGNIGILFLYYGSRKQETRSKIIYATLAGISFSIAWLCKAAVVYLAPFIFFYVSWTITHRDKKNIILLVCAAIPCIFTLCIEAAVYFKYTSDLFYRFHEIQRNFTTGNLRLWFFNEGSRYGWEKGKYFSALLNRIFLEGPRLLLSFPIITVAMAAIGYALIRRLRTFLFPGLWLIFLLFFYNFGTTSFTFYRPLVLMINYLFPLWLPAIVLSAGLLDTLLPRNNPIKEELIRERSFWGIFFSLFIAFNLTNSLISTPRLSKPLRKISRILSPNDVVYADPSTVRSLELLWKFPKKNNLYDFENMDIDDIPQGAYVIIDHNELRLLKAYSDFKGAKFKNLPDSWLKLRIRKVSLYYRNGGKDSNQEQ